MTVVTDRTGEESDRHARTLLVGRPGSGLSRTAAQWPDPYFVLFGGNLRYAGDGLSFTSVTTSDELLAVLTALNGQDLGAPVSTVVVDTVDGMERIVGDDPRKLRALLRTFAALPLAVVFLCHVETVGARLMPAVCIPDELPGFADVALFLDSVVPETTRLGRARTLHRYAQAWPDDQTPWIMDRTGRLPELIGMDDVAAAVSAATAGDVPDALPATASKKRAALAPPVATPEPARERAALAPPVATPEPARAPTPEPASAPVPDAAAPAPIAQPEPAPLAQPEPAAADDDADEDEALPLCTSAGAKGNECLGRVESADSYDLSILRFRRPMCGPCGNAEYEAMPKQVPRKARPASAAVGSMPDAGAPSGAPEAVVPLRGEPVGRIPQTQDDALRDLLRG